MKDEELERLAILAEECAEVQQIVMKIIRHGYESCNPYDASMTKNRELLEQEIGDLLFAINLMTTNDDVSNKSILKAKAKKKFKIGKYLHHNVAFSR